MTRLFYNIRTKNNGLLRDKDTEKVVTIANWKVAQAFAKMVDGTIVPVYVEQKTY